MSTTDNINIDNITFQIEDEELPEVEYFEIVSFEEIIKFNPSFIAFSKEDIYSSLYNFFKDRNKANNFLELFYNIIDRQKKNINTTNFIIVSNAYKKQLEDSDLNDFIISIKNLTNKTQYKLSQAGKNKLWFILDYGDDSDIIRFKADFKTKIEMNNNSNYYVFKDDETNIPVIAIYYEVPTSTSHDYLNNKILSQFNKSIKLDELKSDGYSSFDDLYNEYKIQIPFKQIEQEDDIDYSNLSNLLNKYNISLDFINVNDLNELKEFLEKLLSKEKIYKPIQSHFKIKPINISNNRFTYFDILKNIKSLIEITISNKDSFNETLTYLNEERSVASSAILYNNINDIINAIDLDMDGIIENLKIIKNNFVIDQAIKSLKSYNQLDLEYIINGIEELENNFNKIKLDFKDIYKISFDFAKEEHDIKVGNDIMKYEGGINEKIAEVYEDLAEDEDIYPIVFDADKMPSKTIFDQYYNTEIYKIEEGFIEIIKVILPYINQIQEIANLPIDYNALCLALFNKFRNLPSRANIIENKFKESSIPIDLNYINNISKIKPKNVFQLEANDKSNIILAEANQIFQVNLYNSLNFAVAWWCVELQKEILESTLLFNENNYYLPCISLWNFYGYPFNIKSKDGVVYYISCITEDVFKEDDNYLELRKNYSEVIRKICEDDFNSQLIALRQLKPDENKNKGKDIGREYRKKLIASINSKKFDKLLEEYVDALLYLPADNYEKIHKYLLGCCLQHVDLNFKSDTDIISKKRTDLIAAKKAFAKVREINKPRYAKFHATKEEEVEKNPKIFHKIEEEVEEEVKKFTIEEWLENLKKYNRFSSKIIDDIIDNPKNSLNYTEKYLTKLINTSGNKKDLIQLFLNSNMINNYKTILLSISTVLYDNFKSNESAAIIYNFINDLTILTSIIDDNNKNDINRIIKFIISYSLCLPSNPDGITTVLRTDIPSDINLIEKTANDNYTNITKILKIKIPTLQEQIDFINKIREENKSKKLAVINKMNDDERTIANELKKIGITDVRFSKDEEDFIDEVEEEVNPMEVIEEDGEEEYEIELEEQGDGAEYNSDIRDYGFIYAD